MEWRKTAPDGLRQKARDFAALIRIWLIRALSYWLKYPRRRLLRLVGEASGGDISEEKKAAGGQGFAAPKWRGKKDSAQTITVASASSRL